MLYRPSLRTTKIPNFMDALAKFLGEDLERIIENYLINIAPSYKAEVVLEYGTPIASKPDLDAVNSYLSVSPASLYDIVTAFPVESFGEEFIPGMIYSVYDKGRLSPLSPDEHGFPFSHWFTYNPENASSLKDALVLVLRYKEK